MSKSIRDLEKKWIENFKKSPLVDKNTGVFLSNYAYQLFYGKQGDNYPSDFPHDFLHIYKSLTNKDRDAANFDRIFRIYRNQNAKGSN